MASPFTPRIAEILSYYRGQNAGTLTNLARLLTHGRLGGTGHLVILPVDQGFEHGPARSFAPNPPSYNPQYHVELAIEAGCNAYAAPLGFIEAIAADYAGQIPLILKLNNHDVLQDETDPLARRTRRCRMPCAWVAWRSATQSIQARPIAVFKYEEFASRPKRRRRAGWRSCSGPIRVAAV